MRTAAFLIATLLTPAGFGQFPPHTVDRAFTFTRGETAADLKEIATIIRAMADIRELSVDDTRRALTVRGTPGEIGIAEWICRQLSEPPGDAAGPAFQVPDASGDVMRVFHPTGASTPVALQQLAILVRSNGDIRRAFVYSSRKAIAVRGTPAQMAMAAWFVQALDGPPDPRIRREHRAGDDDVCRVFFLESARNPRDVQEVVTTIRAIADVQRAFPYQNALGLRGNAGQMALAEWLVHRLQQASGGGISAPYRFQTRWEGDQVARVFYLADTTDEQRTKIVTAVRTGANIQRLMIFGPTGALAARGTPERIAAAEQIVRVHVARP